MEIRVISMEKIKPSSPTPARLQIHKISLLDQIILPIYTPLILYFAPDPTSNNSDQKILHLKNSLASTLTTFYPFAGVIKDSFSVDCNDDGLPFSVAKVKIGIRDFLRSPNIFKLINNLLPGDFNFEKFPNPGENVCMIQLNCFDCGGIALSIIVAHFTADMTSICTFLKAWAATARASFQTPPLNCIAQSAFPQNVALPKESNPYDPYMKFLSTGKFITRRYLFDASSISILKAQSNDLSPSRVEVVTALIWKCFMDSVEKSGDNDRKPFVLTHTVNLRRRADPSFPEDSFGNFLWPTAAVHTNSSVKCSKELVSEVRRGIHRIDKEFIKRLQTDKGYSENLEDCRKVIPEEAKWLSFTSWANLELYTVDLGWGRPVWLSGINVCSDSESMFPNNIVILSDTRRKDEIEAWVVLDEKYIAGFEENEELKIHARFNPTIL